MKSNKEIELEENDFVIINPHNGELVGKLREGDKVVTKEQSEHQQKYVDNFNKGEKFLKIYEKAMPILAKKLKYNEFTFLMQLLPYVSYKDNILRYENKVLDMQDLSTLLPEYSYDTVRRIVPSLIRKGVLGIHKTGCLDRPNIIIKCYTVNPFIVTKGTTMDRTIIGLFEKSGWDKI